MNHNHDNYHIGVNINGGVKFVDRKENHKKVIKQFLPMKKYKHVRSSTS